MRNIDDYKIFETLGEASGISTHRARRNGSDAPVLLKEFCKSEKSSIGLSQLIHEYRLLKDLQIPGMVAVLDTFEADNCVFFTLEDFNGIPLRSLINHDELNIFFSLEIAINVAETLRRLHENNFIHGNIKPDSILVDPGTRQIRITDYGTSLLLANEPSAVRDPIFIRETLSYISPEQTGRMNRSVDYRTDFYSLGITLYEMLTTKVPFQSFDAMDLMFSHIAREPVSPSNRVEDIPKTVSNIVMKLLSKTPEDRYQSSFGLHSDLSICLSELQSTGKIELVKLASRDVSIQFISPKVLFGRQKEFDSLITNFNKVSRGENVIVLVEGHPGVGKSALVYEIHKSVVSSGGYFISGKHDLQRKAVPYSAIIQAFQALFRQILTESQENINAWRLKLTQALGSLGGIVVDVLPEVELIVGEQSGVPVLGPEESQNRFILTMKKFISALTSEENPLVLFLDDLQWADSASLHLLEKLLMDDDIKYFYLIGAFRNNEIDAKHPLSATIREIEKTNADLVHMVLHPLNLENVNYLVSSFLKCDEEKAVPVSKIIYEKTGGNPFFVNQFLKTMHDSKMLELDLSSGWKWNLEAISKMELTDDVVDLLIVKINRLTKSTQKILQVCSCIGVEFELSTLAAVLNRSIDDILENINSLIREGLISLLESSYRFSHDRIQEAAFSMTSEEERDQYHYKIGSFLLERTTKSGIQDRILDIVNMLNSVTHLIDSDTEKHELAALNLLAAKKAKASSAYRSVLLFSTTGIELLGENCWHENYDLCLTLHALAAEAAYICTEYEVLDSLSVSVLDNAKSLMHTVRIYDIRIRMFTGQNNLGKAVETGQKVLRLLGQRLPHNPTTAHVLAALARTKLALWGKSYDDLIKLPDMSSEKTKAIATILNRVSPASYWYDPNLIACLLITAARIPIKHGLSGDFAYLYAGYGLILCSIGDIDSGYKFGEVGLALLERFQADECAARTIFTFNCFVKHWKDPAADSLSRFLEGFDISMETGDLEFAGYNIMAYCYTSYWVSKDLFALEKETADFVEKISALKQETPLNVIRMDHQRQLNLMYPSEDPTCLSGLSYDEEIMLPIHEKAEDRTAVFALNSRTAQLSYFFQNYNKALLRSNRAESALASVVGTIDYAVFFYYKSLILLSLCRESEGRIVDSLLKKIVRNQKKMKKWAGFSPVNHLHRYLIVEADLAHLRGDDVEARALFREAIKVSRQNEYIIDESIAHEIYSRFWYESGENDVGLYYLKLARDGYRSWGALAKVAHMEEKHESLTEGRDFHSQSKAEGETRSGRFDSVSLDWATIIKASQAISGEIVLSRLLKKLMELVIENAGARKGLLILEDNEALKIEARIDIENENVIIQEGLDVERSDDLSQSIVHYVHRKRETVLLNNAPYEGLFVNDPYIKKHRPRSVLCAPIVNQENLSAILYLENDLATNAFSPRRLEIVNLLSSQMAISIDNAVLFERMKKAEEHLRVMNNDICEKNKMMEHIIKELRETYDELNRANEKKESIRKHLQNIIDSMPSIMIGIDMEMRITLLNSKAKAVIGNACEDSEGRTLGEVIPFFNENREEITAAIEYRTQKKIERVENIFATDDGYSEVTIYPLMSQGINGAVIRIDNITQRLQIEKLMIQTEKMMSIGGLAAGMAHEINNPLNGIVLTANNISKLLSSDLKRNDVAAEKIGVSMSKIAEYTKANKIDRMLKEIQDMGGRASKIIENTLNYSRKSETDKAPVDMRNLIDETLELAAKDFDLKKKLNFRKVKIIKEYNKDVTYVTCIAIEIVQVLLNITRNAIQAMMGGDSEFKAPRLVFRLSQDGPYVKIEIEDNGPGLTEESIQRVFEPFYTTKKAGVGTGLGLSVSHYIITENHNGKIEVSSTPGGGAIFSIYLPSRGEWSSRN